ncbi:MAG: MFS transporter [Gammaproteobacteria bacterium]|nr:MFS transporter [Gammaproteobacteria bacterium]
MRKLLNQQVISWACYDWANSAFATVVMAGFFPLFYKQYWSAENSAVTDSTFQLGLANSIASILIVILAPILGAIADAGQLRKRMLLLFAALGIVMTTSLFAVEQGQWWLALVCYVLGVVGFSGSVVFYDALIVGISDESDLDLVSAIGFSAGYLGGGILFALNVMMTLSPETFGFVDAAEAVRFSFLTVAIWWGIFSIPLFLYVPEMKGTALAMGSAVKGGFHQLAYTFKEVRKLRVVFLFLLAYWLYIDGVDTIVRMAVDYGMSIGFEANDLITALLITQFVGFPAAIAFGFLGKYVGTKKGILLAILVYLAVTIWAYTMNETWEFYLLAVVIGLVQGGIQSLSRSFYARIIPADKSAEFFGFYNMMGKFAAVLGPLMMGGVGLLTGSPRLGILSVSLLFIIGGVLLLFVDEKEGQRMARIMD